VSELENSKCPIWGLDAKTDSMPDAKRVQSPRAGGEYIITGSAESHQFSDEERVALSSYILEENFRNSVPTITSQTLNLLPSRRKSLGEQLNLLMAAATMTSQFGQPLYFSRQLSKEIPLEFYAAIGSRASLGGGDQFEHVAGLLRAAEGRGWVSFDSKMNPILTLEGHLHVESMGATVSESPRIFVAMWFGSEETTRLYEKAIAPAISDAGYAPVRIDNKEHNEKIDDEILAEIRRAKAVVVDMTCGLAKPQGWGSSEVAGAPRGGVYYEAGFAKGLGIPVIWTVKKEIADTENVVHFDVRQYAQLRWTNDLKGFRDRLRFRIEATLGRGSEAV